jgi:hypothetical protein
MAVTQFKRNIKQLQECMWEAGTLMDGSIHRLEGANTLAWIEDTVDKPSYSTTGKGVSSS